MRVINVFFIKNTGDGTSSTFLNFTSDTNIVDIGALQWNIENDLTKVSPGNISLSVVDFDGSIYTFMQDQLSITEGLLPPFVIINIDGERHFVGIVLPNSLSYDEYTKKLTIASQDWSQMISKIYLSPYLPDGSIDLNSPWQRRRNRTSSGGTGTTTLTLSGWYPNADIMRYWNGQNSANEVDKRQVFFDPTEGASLKFDDKLTCPTITGNFTIDYILPAHDPLLNLPYIYTQLGNFTGPNPNTTVGNSTATFTRTASSTTPTTGSVLNDYTIKTAIIYDKDKPVYAIHLDNCDNLIPGDKLITGPESKQANTYTVSDIDYERSEVIVLEKVAADLALDQKLYLSDESSAEIVFRTSTSLIEDALKPYFEVKFDKFAPSTLPVPVFSYLPYNSGTSTEDIIQPTDIQPNLSTIDIKGVSQSWSGTPETTWSTSTWTTNAIWTDQTLSTPSSLMTDETTTLAPFSRWRNRSYVTNWNTRNFDNGVAGFDSISDKSIPVNILAHNYSNMTRIYTTLTTYRIDSWSGSWSTGSSVTWPWSEKPLSICPFPAAGGWLVLTSAGTLRTLLGSAATLTLTEDDQKQGVLVNTPYGVYLVSSRGYGKVNYSGGSLTIPCWMVVGNVYCNLFPNTFCAYDSNIVYCIGTVKIKNPNPDPAYKDYPGLDPTLFSNETYLYKLKANPSTTDSILSEYNGDIELLSKGTFRHTCMINDHSGRLIGLLGGRLFEISTKMSVIIERLNPQGMTALELVEHICQIQNCMAVPNGKGFLEIISRDYTAGSVTDITVDQISSNDTRVDESFFSRIRVGGKDEKIYFDTSGLEGGDLLEMGSHPLIFSRSQAQAVAIGLSKYFGVPRNCIKQDWICSDMSAVPAWESIQPLDKITLNGDTTKVWIVKAISRDISKNKATVTLLEYIAP